MNVWIVNHYSRAPSEGGGTRHYSLARELKVRGHQVFIIASSFDYQSLKETRACPNGKWELETVDGIRFLWIRTPPYRGNTLGRLWNMLVFCHRVWAGQGIEELPQPHLMIGSSPHPFAALAGERVARRLRVPFILEVRDLWPETLLDLGKFSRWHPFILALGGIEKYLYRHAARIITLLPDAWRYMAEKGVPREKVFWLPNGIDLTLVPQPSPPPRCKVFTLMYAGAHGIANNLEILLEGARILQRRGWGDQVRIRLIGDGPEKTRLKQKALENRIDLVSFEDSVPKSLIYDKLQEADAFVMILKDAAVFRWGLSPNKLFDYLASARPILFAIKSDLNPVADAQAGLSIPPDNPEQLAEGIIALVKMDPGERWNMGLRGRRYVEEQYSLAMLAGRLEAVLREVLGQIHKKN